MTRKEAAELAAAIQGAQVRDARVEAGVLILELFHRGTDDAAKRIAVLVACVGLGSDLIIRPNLASENGVQKKADRPPERSVADMDARHQEVLDAMLMTAQCAFCAWTFEGPAAEAREKGRAHREQEHPGRSGAGSGSRGSSGWKRRKPSEDQLAESEGRREIHERAAQREALGRMDAGEPQKPQAEQEPPEPARAPTPRLKWTRETGIAAIRAFAAEHGRPPSSNDLRGLAIACSQRADMPPWAALVEAAGFPRPTLATRYRKPLGAGEPGETPTPSRGPDAPDAGPSPAPSGPGVSEPAERALPADQAALPAPAREADEPPPTGSGATRAPAPLLTPYDLPERFRAATQVVQGIVVLEDDPAIAREILEGVCWRLRDLVGEAYS